MKISVMGDGAWGTALAMDLLENGHEVTMWGAFPDYLELMAESRVNSRFLPGVKLPGNLQFTPDAETAAQADLLILATPTQFLRSVLKKLAPFADRKRSIFVNVAKGIEVGTNLRISGMVEQELGNVRYVALSGPSHAEEVSRRIPTLVTVASQEREAAEIAQKALLNDRFRVYTSGDVVGVELGGALKNVFAIAGGIIDGMKLGDNPKAAMMTRAIHEMGTLGEKLGGERNTFAGLSGIGDLIVTCCSGHSRNRHVGEELGRGKKLPEILNAMGMVVAEGVTTAQSAFALAREVHAETPIIDEIHNLLYDGGEVRSSILNLMTRPPKDENIGNR